MTSSAGHWHRKMKAPPHPIDDIRIVGTHEAERIAPAGDAMAPFIFMIFGAIALGALVIAIAAYARTRDKALTKVGTSVIMPHFETTKQR